MASRGSWLGLGLACLLAAGCDDPEPLPKLARVPDFELVGQDGESFRGREMEGRVWIVDFIFTSCVTYCPMLTERMEALREELHDDGVHFMSVSVDPEHDTPEVLREYAEKHGADHDDWVFLTGETAKVSRAVVRGFKTPMGDPVEREGGEGYDILHARHFLLVGPDRHIRGYYRTDDEGLERLREHAERLAAKGGGES